MGDPQTDGQANVTTEISFTFGKLKNITGLKAEISDLNTGAVQYEVALGEFKVIEDFSGPGYQHANTFLTMAS